MANTAVSATVPGAAFVPARRRFTADEYHRMGEAGILPPDERTELIEGEILLMPAIGSRHMACVNDFTRILVIRVGDRAIVSIQNPVRLSSGTEPQPDIVLLRPRPDRYVENLPGPDDVLLLVEVADTTFGYDRRRKLPLYAAAGIREVWIADLGRRRVLVHRSPEGDAYQRVTTVTRGGTLAPEAFPDITLTVAGLFA